MVSLLLLRIISSSRVVLLLLYIVRSAATSSLAWVILIIGVIPITGIVHSIYIIVASIASRAMTVVGRASSASASAWNLIVLILIILWWTIKVKIWVHAIATINRREFLNKVVDMSRIVLLLSEHISASSDLFDQDLSLLPLANLDALLNYVVSISILHHGI